MFAFAYELNTDEFEGIDFRTDLSELPAFRFDADTEDGGSDYEVN